MKKASITKTCSVVFVIIIMIIVMLFVISSEPEPSYQFFSGRADFAKFHVYSDPSFRQITYLCSFQADFNDICAQADKELLALGYEPTTAKWAQDESRLYQINGKSPKDYSAVRIHKNLTIKKYLIDTNSNPAFRTGTFYSQEGWIIVEVIESKTQNKYVGKIKHLLYKLHGWE